MNCQNGRLITVVLVTTALAACGGSRAASHPDAVPTVTVPAAVQSPACPIVMADVHRIAKAMDIDLTTGNAHFAINSAHIATWFGDLFEGVTAADWEPGTTATRTLKQQWMKASTDLLKIRNNNGAETFIADLQTIANTCQDVS